MAFVTLYRFRVELSDVDRGVYETLDFRAALHPSETTIYLVTRVLAFVLNWQEGLEFSSGGLSDPDSPAIKVDDPQGGVKLWIEIGNPNARKLHKASKASRELKVYTYKDPQFILRDMETEKVHNADKVGVFSFDSRFLESVVASLEKDNAWSLYCGDQNLVLNLSADRVLETELKQHKVTSSV